MVEVYKIAIGISLTNNVSGVLGLIARQFMTTNAAAVRLQQTLNSIRLASMVGVGLAGAGFLGLDVLRKTIEPAREYAHELALMNQTGMQHADIVKVIGEAWKTTGSVMTTTATENLRAAQELRQVFGAGQEGMAHLLTALPTIQKIEAIIGSYTGRGGQIEAGEAYTLAKALELAGAVQTPGEFTKQADMMAKAIEASRGQVKPQDFLSAFKYGRVATQGWSDQFKYLILPTLIQEMKSSGGAGGAGGPGNALMSAYAAVVGGTIQQKSLAVWSQMGLLDPSKLVYTRTHSLKGAQPGAVHGWELFQQNPYQWVQEYLIPAMQARHLTPQQEQQYIQYMFPNRTAGFAINQMATQNWKFARDIPLYQGQQGLGGYQQLLMQDPALAQAALRAQLTNVGTLIGTTLIPLLLPALHALADALQYLVTVMQGHPGVVTALTYAFAGLSGALLFSGVVLTLTAAFWGLRTVLGIAGITQLIGPLRALAAAPFALAAGGVTTIVAAIAALAAVGGAFKLAYDWLKADEKKAPAPGRAVHLPVAAAAAGAAGTPHMEYTGGVGRVVHTPVLVPGGALSGVRPPAMQQHGAASGGVFGDLGGAVLGELKTMSAHLAEAKNVTLTGVTNLTGEVRLSVEGFADMIGRMVAKGIQHAVTGLSGSGARPAQMSYVGPT